MQAINGLVSFRGLGVYPICIAASLGAPLQVSVLPFGRPFGVRPVCIWEHSLINIVRIVSLPFLSFMDNLVIACKVWVTPENLARMLWLSSSTVSLQVVWVVLSLGFLAEGWGYLGQLHGDECECSVCWLFGGCVAQYHMVIYWVYKRLTPHYCILTCL